MLTWYVCAVRIIIMILPTYVRMWGESWGGAGLYTEILPRGGEFGVWTKEGGRAGWKLNSIM